MAKKIEAGVSSADINTKLVEEILSQSNPKEGTVKLSKLESKGAIFLDFRQQEVFE